MPEAAARRGHQQIIAQAQAMRAQSQMLRALSVTARAHSHLLRQRSRATRAALHVHPAAQRAGVQTAFRRCQGALREALRRLEGQPPSALPAGEGLRQRQQALAAPLAELSYALWCWTVCGTWAAPLIGAEEDQAWGAWLAELLTAYAQVERQLHGLMRRPPELQSLAALQHWVAGLGRRFDCPTPESSRAST
jgi:hypothetical protein